jgi:hypothetical protein
VSQRAAVLRPVIHLSVVYLTVVAGIVLSASDGLRVDGRGSGASCCLILIIETGAGTHPASYPVRNGTNFFEGKAAGT